MANEALANLKVLEYAELVSGPYCTKLMGDLGAEVIKIEKTGTGDEARKMEPFYHNYPHPEHSGLFYYLNTNKMGITLNLKTETGQEIFKRLIADTDVLVEDTSPGMMEQQGLSYEALKQINPSLIMTSITPFGQYGPYRNYKSCDLITNAAGGLAYITPLHAEVADQPPLKPGGRQADFFAGLLAATATIGAIYGRRSIQTGQHIDVSAQECLLYILSTPIMSYNSEGHIMSRKDMPSIAPRHLFRCADGYVWIQIAQPGRQEWEHFVQLVGESGWADSELFYDTESRARCWDALQPLIQDWASGLTKEELRTAAQKYHLPMVPLNSIEEVATFPQFLAREFFIEVEHPKTGKISYPGAPYKLSQTPWNVKHAAPCLGEHNMEIFGTRLGYTQQDLVKMREAKII